MKTLMNLLKRKRNTGSSAEVEKNITSQTQYYCPMKCEGEKTYDVPGNCPECNMKLVPVNREKLAEHHTCCG
jgi:Cu2+-exporting ATPase